MADIPLSLFDDSVKARFWAKVDVRGRDECWHWLGGRNMGYRGSFTVKGITCRAARIALTLEGGPPRESSLLACHTCDNPLCVNPNHLWWGTNLDNMRDCRDKGRIPMGQRTHCSRGHPYEGDNFYAINNDGSRLRRCRLCARERHREKADLRKATESPLLFSAEKLVEKTQTEMRDLYDLWVKEVGESTAVMDAVGKYFNALAQLDELVGPTVFKQSRLLRKSSTPTQGA